MIDPQHALRSAKEFSRRSPNWAMLFCPDKKEEFWRLFADPTPGKITVLTGAEVVLACLFYYWMKKEE